MRRREVSPILSAAHAGIRTLRPLKHSPLLFTSCPVVDLLTSLSISRKGPRSDRYGKTPNSSLDPSRPELTATLVPDTTETLASSWRITLGRTARAPDRRASARNHSVRDISACLETRHPGLTIYAFRRKLERPTQESAPSWVLLEYYLSTERARY